MFPSAPSHFWMHIRAPAPIEEDPNNGKYRNKNACQPFNCKRTLLYVLTSCVHVNRKDPFAFREVFKSYAHSREIAAFWVDRFWFWKSIDNMMGDNYQLPSFFLFLFFFFLFFCAVIDGFRSRIVSFQSGEVSGSSLDKIPRRSVSSSFAKRRKGTISDWIPAVNYEAFHSMCAELITARRVDPPVGRATKRCIACAVRNEG